MAPSSSSGLTFKLHPLVIVNISDHYTRVKTQLNPPPSVCATENASSNNGEAMLQPNPRVYGCVIGVQRGRTVEIFNSFELLFDPSTETLDRSFLEKKQELLAAHLTGIHSAIKMLNSRIRVLHQYLAAMEKGDIPCENSLLRQVSSLLRRLPAMESERFHDNFLMEYNDKLLVTYLAMITNCTRCNCHWTDDSVLSVNFFFFGSICSTMNEMVDKFNIAYDRNARRGGRTAFM
ncbi:hypothetical protein F2Q68_00021846 [Brassica cretica]|uniref:EIF3F/CSN6-like C-terminal domain-containing protein n=1 Tax=Brassica cretica TaxID=69181 RepID=A0A8S9FVW4_BRACR|nr:hypothetical protein F2Q68_00021846 [Brassica cretica]